MKTVCRGVHASEYEEYLRFARIAWGSGSAQASRKRLEWLYGGNPYSRGSVLDLLALFDGDRIVGCHHYMQLPWMVGEERIVFPTFFDIFVLPEYRSRGGFELITTPYEGLHASLCFGLSDQSEKILSILHKASAAWRTQQVRSFWMEKIYPSVRGISNLMLSKIGITPKVLLQERERAYQKDGLCVQATTDPSPAQIEAALSCTPDASIYTDWDEKSFRWRFFGDGVPPHLLLLALSGGDCLGRALISFGSKRGTLIGRLVELTAPRSEAALHTLVHEIDMALRRSGVAVALAATTDAKGAAVLGSRGWSERKKQPGSRIFLGKRSADLTRCHIWGGSWDFGTDLPARVTLR